MNSLGKLLTIGKALGYSPYLPHRSRPTLRGKLGALSLDIGTSRPNSRSSYRSNHQPVTLSVQAFRNYPQ